MSKMFFLLSQRRELAIQSISLNRSSSHHIFLAKSRAVRGAQGRLATWDKEEMKEGHLDRQISTKMDGRYWKSLTDMHVRSANVSQWTAIRIQNTLTIREWITLRMVSSLTAIDLTNEKNILCSVTLAVTATWINSCLFLERTEYLCEIEQYYSINKRDGNLQRIDQKSWTIDLWTGHELDMSETCNGFYNISSPCLGIEA